MTNSQATRQVFHLFLIKPSHYDDDGYVIQWARSSIPVNTLAALYGLARDCADRNVLGEKSLVEKRRRRTAARADALPAEEI